MIPDLDTNRAYLIQTIRERSHKGLWATFEKNTDEEFVSHFERLIQRQLLPDKARDQIRKDAQHANHPLDNPMIKFMERTCRKLIGHNKTQLSQVPTGLVLTKYLNAEALKGENDEVGIVIDLGLISSIEQMLHVFFRFSRHHFPMPNRHYRKTCARALHFLADFCVLGDWQSFAAVSRIEEQVTPEFFKQVTTCTGVIHTFILLHEYAHVCLGHLDDCPVNDTDRLITKSKDKEIQADVQAIQWLIASEEYRNIVPSVCHILGLLFRFQHLCEMHPSFDLKRYSHPSAMERWDRIKALLTEKNSACVDAANQVDEPYDEVVAEFDYAWGRSPDDSAIDDA
jgi:hypothetical protein